MEIFLAILVLVFIVFQISLHLKLRKIQGISPEQLDMLLSRKFADLNSTATNKEHLEIVMNQMAGSFGGQIQLLNQQINQLSQANEQRLEAIRNTVATELQTMRGENTVTLEQLRQTVDQQLQNTLERRLGESFNQVGVRLEQVHRGLGEMQSLAAGVSDLQKVLRNVKIRGTWGEVQLGAILAQMLTTNQYGENVAVVPGSNARVEYALALPEQDGQTLWLPLDSKCPLEDYQRWVEAMETGNNEQAAKSEQALAKAMVDSARDIFEKYVKPPYTTDFAMMFLPIEGMYGLVLQNSDLCQRLHRDYRVLVAGPTTLAALLNVVQLAYGSLAVSQRSHEVWQLLAIVKQEFNDFGQALARSQKKIQEAGNVLELASRRTRVMERKLKNIEILDNELNNSEIDNLDSMDLEDGEE